MDKRRILFDPADSGLLDTLMKRNVREGEEALILAVLGNAIEYYQEYLLATDEKGKKLFEEAETWIFEGGDDYLFSFEGICAVLRLDPCYLRQGLLSWKEAARKSRSESEIAPPAVRKKAKQAA